MADRRPGNSEEVAETLRHAAAQLGQDLSRTAHDAKEAARELGAALGRTIGETASVKSRDASRALSVSIRQHPAVWLLAAIGAGAVLALLVSRQRHEH